MQWLNLLILHGQSRKEYIWLIKRKKEKKNTAAKQNKILNVLLSQLKYIPKVNHNYNEPVVVKHWSEISHQHIDLKLHKFAYCIVPKSEKPFPENLVVLKSCTSV